MGSLQTLKVGYVTIVIPTAPLVLALNSAQVVKVACSCNQGCATMCALYQ